VKKGVKALRAVVITGVRQVEVQEVEDPKPNGKDVIIKVGRIGICGSDVRTWNDGPENVIMGHEFSGTVADPGASNFHVGDKVIAMELDPCRACPTCYRGYGHCCPNVFPRLMGLNSPGCYAEYIAVRPDMVLPMPHLTFEEGAAIEPATVALHAVKRAKVTPGDKVLVSGAGPIGLLAAMWCKVAGAAYIAISEPNPVRAKKALEYGDVSEVFDPTASDVVEKMLAATDGGFEVAIDCVGVPSSMNLAAETLIYGDGKIMVVGTNGPDCVVPNHLMTAKEIQILGSFIFTEQDFASAVQMYNNGQINLTRFVTSTVGFDGVQKAMETLVSPQCQEIKIQIDPSLI
jgi:2-desacetyl-2-hydroxyethyl bacteriochlorophyllide A dehydrogenase